jgi:F-type H+-transporting ATPase subunit b
MRVRRLLALGGLAAAGVLASAGVAVGAEEGEHAFADHAAEECFEILEGGGTVDDCQESPSPILPEVNEIIWGSAAFAVLFVAFVWKGFPAVQRAIATREERIRGDLERAEGAKSEAEQVLAQYQAQLGDARTDAGRIVDEARHAAEQVRRDVVARAEQEAAEVRARAAADVALASDRALADLRGQVAQLSIELAEKIVERNLDPATQQSLIDSYINSVGRN